MFRSKTDASIKTLHSPCRSLRAPAPSARHPCFAASGRSLALSSGQLAEVSLAWPDLLITSLRSMGTGVTWRLVWIRGSRRVGGADGVSSPEMQETALSLQPSTGPRPSPGPYDQYSPDPRLFVELVAITGAEGRRCFRSLMRQFYNE